jgi:hypothetical protein
MLAHNGTGGHRSRTGSTCEQWPLSGCGDSCRDLRRGKLRNGSKRPRAHLTAMVVLPLDVLLSVGAYSAARRSSCGVLYPSSKAFQHVRRADSSVAFARASAYQSGPNSVHSCASLPRFFRHAKRAQPLTSFSDDVRYLVCRSLSASAVTFSSSAGSTGFVMYAFASSNRDCKALSRLA